MDEKILGAGIAVDIFAETSNETIALDLIRKEGVISIGYDYMDLLHPAPDIAVRPLDASESGSELNLVTLKNTLPRKSARQFRQFLLDWIPAHGKDQIAWPGAQYSTVCVRKSFASGRVWWTQSTSSSSMIRRPKPTSSAAQAFSVTTSGLYWSSVSWTP